MMITVHSTFRQNTQQTITANKIQKIRTNKKEWARIDIKKRFTFDQWERTGEEKRKKKGTLLGGLEPPAFRLTAERANQLRHKSLLV